MAWDCVHFVAYDTAGSAPLVWSSHAWCDASGYHPVTNETISQMLQDMFTGEVIVVESTMLDGDYIVVLEVDQDLRIPQILYEIK